MALLKEHQPATTVDEQIKNLHDLGLIIDNPDQARQLLCRVSYYRFIKAYSIGLKNNDGTYKKGVTFSHLASLYSFNSSLRHSIFPVIEDIEILMRCEIASHFCLKYGVLGYRNASHFDNVQYHEEFMGVLEKELARNQRNPFVKNFKENYVDASLPFYAIVEIISFGDLSKFYKNMHAADKKEISRHAFGIGYTYLQSWLESFAYVRNICAHYGRLYNAPLSKSPALYDQYKAAGISNNRLFAVLLCLNILCKNTSSWHTFVEDLKLLSIRYPCVDLSTMGFPDNWEELIQK